MVKTGYRTKQAEKILTYLQMMAGKHVTAKDILEYFSRPEDSIGIATIYRHLDKMVEQGAVKKYILDSNTAACFQFIVLEGQGSEHFHLKCEKCGKLIHFDCVEFAKMQEHLAKKHGFAVNSLKTVLYGLCNECNNTK